RGLARAGRADDADEGAARHRPGQAAQDGGAGVAGADVGEADALRRWGGHGMLLRTVRNNAEGTGPRPAGLARFGQVPPSAAEAARTRRTMAWRASAGSVSTWSNPSRPNARPGSAP